jgi:DNA polymerase III delta prime subunit
MSEKVITERRTTHYLWAEKYRPKNLDEFVGNDGVKAKIKNFIDQKDIPHLLFYGTAGGGKTTLAKMLVKHIPCDHLYINASDERTIDTIRDKIVNFAATVSFEPLRIVILDECLAEDTTVYVLRDGVETPVPIQNLDPTKDLVKSFNVKDGIIEWRPFELWDKGEQDVVRIELENGENVVCTLEHKWYVLNEAGNVIRVKTQELLDGNYDYILSPE